MISPTWHGPGCGWLHWRGTATGLFGSRFVSLLGGERKSGKTERRGGSGAGDREALWRRRWRSPPRRMSEEVQSKLFHFPHKTEYFPSLLRSHCKHLPGKLAPNPALPEKYFPLGSASLLALASGVTAMLASTEKLASNYSRVLKRNISNSGEPARPLVFPRPTQPRRNPSPLPLSFQHMTSFMCTR